MQKVKDFLRAGSLYVVCFFVWLLNMIGYIVRGKAVPLYSYVLAVLVILLLFAGIAFECYKNNKT